MAGADRDRPDAPPGRSRKPVRKPPRKATPESLRNAALHYLGRMAASRDSVRQVLLRRVARSAEAHDTDPVEGAAEVEKLLDRLEGLGLINDVAYARGRTHSLLRQGRSPRLMRAKLAEKGVEGEVIDQALAELAEEQPAPDHAAALALARRRRLGPFRPPEVRAEFYRRDLAALARAGFGMDVARWVLSADDPDSLAADLAERALR